MKRKDLILLAMITLMYTTICMETDIYVPAFPDMKAFFLTSSDSIQHILSINFLGICIGSLLFGPLSDAYGRKKTIQVGLALFALSSWGCLFFTNFNAFLWCRFIQGIGAATPMVITFAILLEKYPPQKVAQLCGGLNLFITGVMAAAPLLGSFLNIYYGWQANFILIAVLATLSFLGSFFFIPETLLVKERIPFAVGEVIKNYRMVLRSFPFTAAACVCYIMFSGLFLFTSNLSLIFIEYLGIAKANYGFYQAAAPLSFALCSFASIWIIGYFGIEKTKKSGIMLMLVGAFLLTLTALIEVNPILICSAMMVYTAGITFAAPIYGMESANVFPQMRGIATGMSNALRHIVIATIVGLGSYLFNGSIRPVVTLIAIAAAVVAILVVMLNKRSVSDVVEGSEVPQNISL